MKRRKIFGTAALAAGTAVGATVAASPGHARRGPRAVKPGIEMLADTNFKTLKGQAVGVISNPTGIFPDLRHEVDVMHDSGDVNIVAVFGPEHGFRGTSQAGDGEDFFYDPKTGLPVYNAYNDADTMAQQFVDAGVETVVFDIQDVGSRFYTYIWTMYRAMEAAAELGLRFVVLDRPNPISAQEAYGPVLHEQHATFVGLKPISQRHGMTVGELAKLFNGEFLPETSGPVDLTVIEMRGWKPDMYFDETGLPWVAPSPNMPTLDTAIAYPGTCLFEATALSEGRGTTQPFELIGAPDIDHAWEEALNASQLEGVRFREAYFNPWFSKWARQVCGGVEVDVTDRDAFDPIRTGLAMIIAQQQLFDQYQWRDQDGGGAFWLDKLTGNDGIRLAIEDGADIDTVTSIWEDDLEAFRQVRREYLIYRRRGRR
ncbi:exo-beta-N-acetylmuramidase NamZ family protein [Natronoglycomyces albus]|uniref:DUF1343 domain-containing protein n=1 Tax=Natronoglycomyces albus TaxID=2811108 RepID=A0A895XKM6_9ACTN|nr:DUF1343 domain-containing protein [Natronoglycomyces albus]QSB04362.1 DUF1343 domain-containing protein [Natronoglycomyces albus]